MLSKPKPRSETDTAPERRPLVGQAYLRVTGSPVALIIAAGLALILYLGVPELRPVLLAIPVGGVVVGALLWWKHR